MILPINPAWHPSLFPATSYKDLQGPGPEDAGYPYASLENKVVPAFYGRDDDGIPVAWIERMRAAMSELPYDFSAHRVVSDYARRFYYVGDEAAV